MIIGRDFAWGHIPRTGGDITAELFLLAHGFDGGLIVTADSPGNLNKHDTFDECGIPDDMPCVLNIRRLPGFLMSWIIMCSGRLRPCDERCFSGGIWPPFTPLPLPTKRQILDPSAPYGPDYFHKYYGGCFATLPDFLLRQHVGERDVRWLRLEYLKADFLEFIATVSHLTPGQASTIMRHKYMIKRPFKYDHCVASFFTPDEIETLYGNNPLWGKIEREHAG